MSYAIMSILFYLLPLLLFVTFAVSLTLFLVEKGKKKREDPQYNGKKQLVCKVLAIASGVILGVMLVVAVAFFVLLMTAVAFM